MTPRHWGGGYGCNASAPVSKRSDVNRSLGPSEEAILVLRRRPAFDSDEDYDGGGDITNDVCFPGEEAANAVRRAGRRWS